MIRLSGATVAVLAVAATASITAASAHVVARPATAVAGRASDIDLVAGHGCHGAATVAVRVSVPEELGSVQPETKEGWTLTVTKPPAPAKAGVSEEIVWRGGPLPDATPGSFRLKVTMPAAAGRTVYLPTIQECEGTSRGWVEIPAAGQDPHALKEPAPFVRLTTPGPQTP